MRSTSVFCLICIFLCATHSTDAASKNDTLFQTADSLFEAGDYFVASIEYERIYYFSEDPRYRFLANLHKARALKQKGEFARARNDLQRSVTARVEEELRFQLFYEMAFCAYMSGDFSDALSLIRQIHHYFGNHPDIGQIYLTQALTYLRLESWDELRNHAGHWVENHEYANEKAKELLKALSAKIETENIPSPTEPKKARMWSTFLPGSGHLYAGEPAWGALNAFSQAFSLGIAGVLIWNGFYIAAGTGGLGMFQSFYFGGIRQAGELAERNSRSEMEQFKNNVAHLLFSIENALKAR